MEVSAETDSHPKKHKVPSIILLFRLHCAELKLVNFRLENSRTILQEILRNPRPLSYRAQRKRFAQVAT